MTNIQQDAHFWQVILPEPFILDKAVSDSQFISLIISANTENDVSNAILGTLQKPNRLFLIHCAETELKKIFTFKHKNIKMSIEKDGDIYLIHVENKENQIIGRGEIIPLVSFIETDHVKNVLKKSIVDFDKRFTEGAERMNSLLDKAKLMKTQIDMTKPFLA